jgi:quinohemoprotein ethanol dehydrogenase
MRALTLLAAALFGILPGAQIAAQSLKSPDNAALGNEADGTDWPAYGRTFGESRFSPLRQVNDSNVSRLRLAWWLDLDVTNSITAPVEAGGVIYLAAGYSIVHAVRATDGRVLWRYDPKVPEKSGQNCGPAGVSADWRCGRTRFTWEPRTADCWRWLVQTWFTPVWSVQTLDPTNGAYISGAPRAFNGKIVIGNAGADFSPVRGYATAYDAETGREIWRFYVVPGKPGAKDGAASDEVMDKAAATWTGEWWKFGGGGNVWNSMTFDPEIQSPVPGHRQRRPANWKIRNPQGRDNLYTASVWPSTPIPATTCGTTKRRPAMPGTDSATDMTLADLVSRDIAGAAACREERFFYVIDRANGRLISAEKLGTVTWAERVDLATGRPMKIPRRAIGTRTCCCGPAFRPCIIGRRNHSVRSRDLCMCPRSKCRSLRG